MIMNNKIKNFYRNNKNRDLGTMSPQVADTCAEKKRSRLPAKHASPV